MTFFSCPLKFQYRLPISFLTQKHVFYFCLFYRCFIFVTFTQLPVACRNIDSNVQRHLPDCPVISIKYTNKKGFLCWGNIFFRPIKPGADCLLPVLEPMNVSLVAVHHNRNDFWSGHPCPDQIYKKEKIVRREIIKCRGNRNIY